MNKQQQDKQIIDNAPDECTHSRPGSDYKYDDLCFALRDLDDIRELVALRDEVGELKKQLKPRLFWDASDTEISHDSIEELIHIKFEDGAKVGDEIEIQRGVILPNEIYVITKIDDDDYSCEYELKGGDV